MKIIFSRKGFDSRAGGKPSPIFPDGSLCSLPIPSDDECTLDRIRFKGEALTPIVEQLTRYHVTGKTGVHFDPDIRRDALPRRKGWLPLFGPSGPAQTHLDNQQVGKGDVFLFFGWFRTIEEVNGRWRYRSDLPDLHCLFGWLQIGHIYHLRTPGAEPPKWASDNPHVARDGEVGKLYASTERLHIPGFRRAIAGGGVFESFANQLCLTAPGRTRSVWGLPAGFYPHKDAPALSFHTNRSLWQKDKSGVLLSTVGRGQEFVLDCDFYPGVIEWLNDIFMAAPIG